MKISKVHLTQIIKEELAAVKKESRFSKDPNWTKTSLQLADEEGDRNDHWDRRRTPGEGLTEDLINFFSARIRFMVEGSGGKWTNEGPIEDELVDLGIEVRERLLALADVLHPEEEADAYDDDDEDYWENAVQAPNRFAEPP